jgi:hypothetical protein
MVEAKDGCVTPARGPILAQEEKTLTAGPTQKEVPKMIAQVGKPGPDLAGKVWKVWKPDMAF